MPPAGDAKLKSIRARLEAHCAELELGGELAKAQIDETVAHRTAPLRRRIDELTETITGKKPKPAQQEVTA